MEALDSQIIFFSHLKITTNAFRNQLYGTAGGVGLNMLLPNRSRIKTVAHRALLERIAL